MHPHVAHLFTLNYIVLHCILCRMFDYMIYSDGSDLIMILIIIITLNKKKISPGLLPPLALSE